MADNSGEPDLRDLISALSSDDWTARLWAAEELGKLRDARAVRSLARGIDDDEHRVREVVAWALGAIGTPEVIPLLAAMLGEAEAGAGAVAASALAGLDLPAAKEALLEAALGESGAEACANAAVALGRKGDARALEAVLKLCERGPAPRSVFFVLQDMGDERAIAPAVAELQRWQGQDDNDIHHERFVERVVSTLEAVLKRSSSEASQTDLERVAALNDFVHFHYEMTYERETATVKKSVSVRSAKQAAVEELGRRGVQQE